LKDDEVAQKCSFILNDDADAPSPAEKPDHKRKASTLLAKEKDNAKQSKTEEKQEDDEEMKEKKKILGQLLKRLFSLWSLLC